MYQQAYKEGLLMDYITTEEGQLTLRLGLEGADWKRNDGKLEITREKTEDGRFVPLSEKYKGGSTLKDMTVLADGFALIDPALPEWLRQQSINNFNNKGSSLNVLKTDWDLYFFSEPNYNKFAIDFANEYAMIVVEPGDLEANWHKWLAEKKPMVDAVLAELNAQ